MVKIRDLPNKPLVEAIVEIKWHVDQEKGDPNHSIFVGRLYNILTSKYPYHESLPTSMVPEIMAGNIVQQRFRIEKDGWPLVQVGPGIVTLNETVKYTWPDFSKRAKELVRSVFKTYPKADELKINSLLLRYIDSVGVADVSGSILDYLKDKLKINIHIPEQLLRNRSIEKKPKAFNFLVAYPTKRPKGTIALRLGTGTREGVRALVWDTAVQSVNEEIPSLPGCFSTWLNEAHSITDDWFFKLIEGELEKEFAGE